MNSTLIISHDDCVLHDMGPEHPESPQRVTAIMSHLAETGLLADLQQAEAQPVQATDLLRVHPEGYIQQLQLLAPAQGRVFADPDTALMKDSLRAASLAAGAAVQATQAVLSGRASTAFCPVRPPGHHAERNTTKGFCFYNNIAVATAYALEQPGIERVAIVDFDVHQCNGTIDIFKDDERVLICSSFQHPFYPHSHYHNRCDHIIDTALEAGSGSYQFRKLTEREWFKPLQDFKPDLVLISAGFDAHKDDPLAEVELTEKDFAWVTDMVRDIARFYSGGRIVSLLEGGYHLPALAASALAHVSVLAGRG